MKILVIGCGGIGSHLVSLMAKASEHGQLDCEVYIADNDLVEEKNILYQDYGITDVGLCKSESLAERYDFISGYIVDKILKDSQLEGYDIIVLAVDNFPTRELVIRYCHNKNKEYIDLRAEGRRAMAMMKGNTLAEDLGLIDLNDKESTSCQVKKELDSGVIQYGNIIAASIGLQMLVNTVRGEIDSRKIILKV
jgi:saccharopine dehydrogenase-like NADP-dependent oxidoreductase